MKGFDSVIREFKLIARGKVRDIYSIDETRLLFVTTDRISAFDSILPVLIPGKGEVLNKLSKFWFGKLSDVLPSHYASPVEELGLSQELTRQLTGRSMVVHRAEVLPVECIVRGYLAGSGFREYTEKGSICGVGLPQGLRESEVLPEPIFTPTTKAEKGHDMPITFENMKEITGSDLAEKVREASLKLYKEAASYALGRGIIIADTKFEFGMIKGQLHLVDEALTPDSSRFWPAEEYRPGGPQKSFDKQYVRDYLKNSGSEGDLPPEVISATVEKYREILGLLTR